MTRSRAKSRDHGAAEANFEFLARRAKRLRDNEKAITELRSIGISDKTVKAFYLGLSEPYSDMKNIVHENALVAPIINHSGKPTPQSVYLNISGVTVNPLADDWWAKGAAKTYYSQAHQEQPAAFICLSLPELWHLQQLIEKAGKHSQILVIASSQAENLPDEWFDKDFWEKFEIVYLGHPNDVAGDQISSRIARFAGHAAKRVHLSRNDYRNWTDFCQNSATGYEEFKRYLADAKIVGAKISSQSNGTTPGRFGYEPVDVAGAPGTGKTALGRTMVKICANASTVGQVSPAAVARLIDETKGFVVFDDLESIGKRKGRDTTQFTELIQALKLSYNKETSWRSLTDMGSGGAVKRLNFYGVKMINNTTGSDPILGSRALKIYTRKIPDHLKEVLRVTEPWDVIELNKLRDELHTWTFENVNLIDLTYHRLLPGAADRSSEIYAPLRVFAELSDSKELQHGLIRALEFQDTVSEKPINPVEILKEVIRRLIVEGETEVFPTQIVLEMEKLISIQPFPTTDESTNWKDAAWIGRQLRKLQAVDVNSVPTRKLVSGKYLRVYPLSVKYVVDICDR